MECTSIVFIVSYSLHFYILNIANWAECPILVKEAISGVLERIKYLTIHEISFVFLKQRCAPIKMNCAFKNLRRALLDCAKGLPSQAS